MKNDCPNLRLNLAPCSKSGNGFVDYIDVSIYIEGLATLKGGSVFSLAKSTVTIPFCPLEGEIAISDDEGEVPIEIKHEKEGFLEREQYITQRDIVGSLSVCYRVKPRVQPDDYRSSPYFDFVSEEGGANGAGLTFLPQFGKEEMFNFSLKWDLANMPSGSRGLWSIKEGDFTLPLKAQEICYSYYAVGLMQSIEKDNFGFYWFSDPSFPVKEAAEKIQELFLYMAKFFEDEGEPYKVFARRNKNASKGGTALKRSYLFGYKYEEALTVDELLNLFAHEMVHNWPHINDEPYGTGNWYSEGAAEYYSVVLPQRAGITSLEEALQALCAKTDGYYANPRRDLSNEAAAKEFWTDRNTQRIPYGRGLIYIIDTDARIRAKSGGKRSVDDIVLEIGRRIKEDPKLGNELWVSLVSRELETDEWIIFNEYMSGKPQTPPTTAFGGAFRSIPHTFTVENSDNTNNAGMQQGYKWEINPDFTGRYL